MKCFLTGAAFFVATAMLPFSLSISIPDQEVKESFSTEEQPGTDLFVGKKPVVDCTNINWVSWSSFTGRSAIGSLNSGPTTISVTMSSNFPFSSTPGIFNYPKFARFTPAVPNVTVPRVTWSSIGALGTTSMCFSETVQNPVLLLSSLGDFVTTSTLDFSKPYIVLYDGGGMKYNNNTSISGTEGFAIIMFPGELSCVTINSTTPEDYTNITWGISPPPFQIHITERKDCGSTTLTATGGVQYNWTGGHTPNEAVNTFTKSGDYTLTVTNEAGCSSTTNLQVVVETATPALSVTVDPVRPVCSGTVINFTATVVDGGAAPMLRWFRNGVPVASGTNYSSDDFKDQESITCQLQSTSKCVPPQGLMSAAIKVSVSPAPTVKFDKGYVLEQGQSVRLSPLVTGRISKYRWTPAAGLNDPERMDPIATPKDNTNYVLQVTSEEGCEASAMVLVQVRPLTISIPNAFSPNADGQNDTWELPESMRSHNVTVRIFNRAGSVIFTTKGYTHPWNGTFNGSEVPVGIYYYVIDLNDKVSKPISGSLTVLR